MDPTSVHVALLLVVLPAWLLVGLVDWYCHRKTQIELTTGIRKSFLHLALSLEAAVAILAAMFFEINALVLAIVLAAFLLHEITTGIDIRIALPARRFVPLEQRMHDYLTAIPVLGVGLLLATHTAVVRGVFGEGAADWSLHWKAPHLPWGYLIAWNALALALNIVPYTEELFRCWRSTSKARKT